MNETAVGIAAVGLLIFGTAVINSVEIAVISSNRIRVHHMAEEGSRRAQALERLHLNQEHFFAAVVVLQTFLVVVAGVVGGQTAERISSSFWVVAGATVLTAWVTAQFGDLIPKVLAARASVSFALAVAQPAEAILRILSPIVQALAFLPSLLSHWLFGVGLEPGTAVTEAELRMLIDISAESGAMEEHEAELLDRVFHFGDRHVHEVMTPRTEAVGVEKQATLGDFYAVYREAHHSRFPVFDESLDSVVGILVIKDVLSKLATGEVDLSSPVEPIARQALFVPETKLIGELFREMQARGDQMAIAVDEFGGTAGIVTLEQLLEEMVGQVRDELWPEEAEITTIDEHTKQIEGGLGIEEARGELALNIPDGDYDTVAGYVLSMLGHIPKVGETVTLDGCRIVVAEMRGLKIEQLRVTRA
jgi:magnesium and cobalt exporter, CNNM family